jgi:hypothetical protein
MPMGTVLFLGGVVEVISPPLPSPLFFPGEITNYQERGCGDLGAITF